MQLDEARVKDLVSDDTITARHLYGSFFSFNPSHKLIVASNHLPIVAGTDHGIWRRIRVARFEARFDENKRDVHLLEKLMGEASGILNWMIQGCMEWQEQGLATPYSIDAATLEYRDSLDVVGQFIEQCCTTAAADPENARAYKVGASVLVDAYQQFAQTNALPQMSGRALAHELKQRGFQSYKSNGTMIYSGLAVYRPWVSDRLRDKILADSGSLAKAGIWEPVVGAFVVDPTEV